MLSGNARFQIMFTSILIFIVRTILRNSIFSYFYILLRIYVFMIFFLSKRKRKKEKEKDVAWINILISELNACTIIM